MCYARISIIGSISVLWILFSYTHITLAVAPTWVPYSWAIPGWAFSAYFQNITKPCNGSNEMIFAFNSAPGPDYGLRLCREMEFYWKSKDSGNNIFFTGAGNVGIGVENPTSKVDIRGNLGLSGTLVDSSNTNYFLQPSLSSTLYKLIIQWEISGPTPVKDEHLATKWYVDAALAAAGVGGGLKVYQSDGITLVGNFLTIDDTNSSLTYSTPTGAIRVITKYDRQGAVEPMWDNSSCDGKELYILASYESVLAIHKKDGSYMVWYFPSASLYWGRIYDFYRWNRNTNTCVFWRSDSGADVRSTSSELPKKCGAADCLIK